MQATLIRQVTNVDIRRGNEGMITWEVDMDSRKAIQPLTLDERKSPLGMGYFMRTAHIRTRIQPKDAEPTDRPFKKDLMNTDYRGISPSTDKPSRIVVAAQIVRPWASN